MKKQTLTQLFLCALAVFTVIACKKKEKEGYTSNNEEPNEELMANMAPVNAKLPSDVYPSCTIDAANFNTWFKSGKVTENGIVNPANSVTFGHQNNCDFYKWSEQMFLWITSPTQEGDYTNGTIMESPVFYTVSPSVNNQRTLIAHEPGKMISVVSNVQKTDSRVDTEEGQATDDVLMSQKQSLLYYITMVNDVYAQFLTGAKTGKLTDNTFPTTQEALDGIVAFAASNGVKLQDPNALAIELKTSWVDASTVSNVNDYVTIDAIVPTYDKSKEVWVPNGGTETVKLAMIGAHIVGSTAGHPEMVWATFEHSNNAPNLSYTYVNNQKKTVTVPADSGNNWLLNGDSASDTYNVSHMTFRNDSIIANTNETVSASNTKMVNAWGVVPTGKPNPENDTPADANTEIIAMNNSILGKLATGDLRKNYIFIGATWTNNGAAPNGDSYSSSNTVDGVAIGSNQLANSTMETYAQYSHSTSAFPGENASCFRCHHNKTNGVPGLKPTDLSHVYGEIKPLSETVKTIQ